MSSDERKVLLWFFALFLAVLGIFLLLRGQGAFPEEQADTGYLAGVIYRTYQNAFQLVLAAGLVAVVLHLIAALVLMAREESVDGYERLGPWLQVLFTSFGFLGTVIGVSIAIAGLPDAMNQRDPSLLIAGLSAAFDTTFIGLLASILVMIGRQILRLTAVSA